MGLRREWAYRVNEAEILVEDLQVLGGSVIHHRSLNMRRHKIVDYELVITRIKKENNRMLLHRSRFYILKLARK